MQDSKKSERSTKFEPLEVREMLAADVFLKGGVLQVDGTNSPDRIEIAEVANEKIEVTVKTGENEFSRKFSAANVKLIEVHGNNGNDLIKNETSIRSRLFGGNGRDILQGGSRVDFISGDDGNDRLIGNAGSDRLVGGPGSDQILGNGGNDTLIGNGGHDRLFGHAGNDTIRGGGGNDRLLGGGGNDVLQGDSGDDQLFGHGGNDQVDGSAGNDSLNGGSGSNQIITSSGDTLSLVGNDSVDNKAASGKLDVAVVNRILTVAGSDEADLIQVKSTSDGVSLLEAGNEIGRFKGVHSVEIVAKGGADEIDLSELEISSRVFGGDGNDTIIGGKVADVLFGGSGDDTIYGKQGDDVIYGDHGIDIIKGEAGADWISFGTTPDARANDTQTFSTADVDIEKLDYDAKVLFDLQHRYRDKYGFVMLQSHGNPNPDGEATYVTAATAAGLAAQTYNMSQGQQLTETNQLIEELLFTLVKHPWDSHGNPVRHPDIFDYDSDGNFLRVDPMTKDAFGQIVTAAYYAHQSPNTTAEAKALAVDLIQKWNEYLVKNQFRTVPEHIWQEVKAGEGNLNYEIYSKNEDGSLKKKMSKGPEAYLLMPHERYAIKNVGSRIGLNTAQWDVWKGLGQSVSQVATDYVGNLAEQGVKTILQQIKFSKSIDVELSYKGKVYFEIDETISFDISSSTEDRIAAAVGDLIKGIAKAGKLAASGDELNGLIVDRLLDVVPDELGVNVWRPIMTTAVNQVMPFMNGEILTEVSTFITTLQAMKKDTKPANFGYSVWSFLAEMESRPEVNDLLRPFVRDMVGYLRGNDVDNGMWAHIGRDSGAVSNQLGRFRDAEIGRDRWSDFSLHRGKDFWDKEHNADKACPRIDYVVLNGLYSKGAPDGVGDVLTNWTKRMANAAENALQDLVNQAKQEFANAGEYLKEKWDQAGRYVKEKWDIAGKYLKERGNAIGKTYVEIRDAAGKLVSKAWTNGTNWISQRFDSAGNVIKEWIYFDEAGEKLQQFRKWAGDKLTDLEQFTKDGWKSVDKWVNDKGQWISQRLDSAGKVIKEWIYYDEAGEKLQQFRKWAGGKLTDLEQFTKDGWKSVDKWISDKGQWISQRLDSAGKVIKEWIYYDDAGKKMQQFRKWAGDKLTDLEQFTTDGWKSVDKWISDNGQWISQRLDSAGKVIKEWIYYDDAGKKIQQFRKWAGGRLTDLEQFTTDGWKSVDKWVNDKGQWISQRLNSAGKVFKQWIYYDAAGTKLKQWATWSGTKLTNLENYATNGLKTLDAYFSTSGHWVEKTFVDGKEVAIRFWTAAGDYVGDQLKNFKDAASNYDPTTKGWWPF